MTGHASRGPGRTLAHGLYTDLYELRMVETYLARGMTAPATFSLFTRAVPERPWYVALGVQRAIELFDTFRYGREELEYLERLGFRPETLDWLAAFRPSGELYAVEDGTIVLADEPIIEYTAPLPEAQLLETALINLIHLSTLAATKAARLALAAKGRPVVDFGYRRAHGLETGIEVALAAWLGGGLATSNVEAGRRYGIPAVGTMAHSLVQAFEDETDAFRAFAQDHPDNTVLLVDTYDSVEGVRRAITVADELRRSGRSLQAIRLDSGNLGSLANVARRLLDEGGHPDVKIFVSGGLDEGEIARLVDESPVDAFGVGSDLAVSSDLPALDIVYKLVDYDGRGVAKFSEGKNTLPGAKQVFREGGMKNDILAMREEELEGAPLLSRAWRAGKSDREFELEHIRSRVQVQLEALPPAWQSVDRSDPIPRPELSERLRNARDLLQTRAATDVRDSPRH